MESRGVPTAPMVTARFADYVTKDSQAHGMPLRFSFPPHPVGWVPRETLQGYIKGDDPVTGRPLMQELIDALTVPLTEAEKNAEAGQAAPTGRGCCRRTPRPTQPHVHRERLDGRSAHRPADRGAGGRDADRHRP